MSGSASTVSLSPVPQFHYVGGHHGSDNAHKHQEDPSPSASSAPSALPGRRSVSPGAPLGRRSVSPRAASPRGSNVSRIIAALETVIPTGSAPAAAGSTAHSKVSPATPKATARSDDEDGVEAPHPVEIGSTPHASTLLRTVEPKRAASAASSSASADAFTKADPVGDSTAPAPLTATSPLPSMRWRRPPPSPRAANKPRLVDQRYSPYSDSPVLETIDLPPQDDELYGSFIPVPASKGGIHNAMRSPPRDVPDFGNISAISHDDASGESPVLIQVHCDRLEVKEATDLDAGPGEQDEEERDVPTELVKTRSNRTCSTVLSDAYSDPSTTTEVTSNVTAASGHPLTAPTSPRFSRSAVLAQRTKISSRRISNGAGKSKRPTPPASASSSPSSNDRRRTPRRGSSTPPKPTSASAASPGGKPRARSTGRRLRYGSTVNPTTDSDESIDSQATQETLDPALVQYFLDLILAEEGIADKNLATSGHGGSTDAESLAGQSEAGPHMNEADTRSRAKAMLDGQFGADGSKNSRSPKSVIVDFWKSFACENLWLTNDKEEKGRSTAERNSGEDQSPFAAFDATFFQELWKEIEAYRETCGSLSNVQDLKAYVSSSRSETPATTTTATTDFSGRSHSGKESEFRVETRKSGRSDIMNFCVPKDKSIGSKDRSNLILQRCKQRYPMLYDRLVQRLEDERARRKLGLLRRQDEPTDSAFTTCTDEYTSGQELSAESVDTSDNANDTPRTANRGTVTRQFQSIPVGFGVLRAPVKSDELPPRSASSRQGRSAIAGLCESTSEGASTKESVSHAVSAAYPEHDDVRLLAESAARAPLEPISPSVGIKLGDDVLNHEHSKPISIERSNKTCHVAEHGARTQSEIGAFTQVHRFETLETPTSVAQRTDCIGGDCNPLEPKLETNEMTSLHPPDVVVKRCCSTDKNEDGFNDTDSFGVHSNLTDDKKWTVPDSGKQAEEKKSKRSSHQSRSVILTDLSEVLGADRFDSPCDDNEKSTASGKEILADLALMTDPGTVRDYSKVVRRSSRSRSGSRERPTITTTNESALTPRNSPPQWEVFESVGFHAEITPRNLFPDNAKIKDKGVWEDFTARENGAPVMWPKNEGHPTMSKSPPSRDESSSRVEKACNTSEGVDALQNRTMKPPMPSELDSQAVDQSDNSVSVIKGHQRFSLVSRIRSSPVSKTKSAAAISIPSPKKGWLRRRSKPRTQGDELDQAEWRRFDASPLECDASLTTLDDAPTAALLQSKGSPTSVIVPGHRAIR